MEKWVQVKTIFVVEIAKYFKKRRTQLFPIDTIY